MKTISLDKNWQFRQKTQLQNVAQSFLPVGQFPTVAHLDLLHHGLIPDPYLDMNEAKVLWVNEADWVYRTEHVPAIGPLAANEQIDLVFEGLDTVADVYLNGAHILSTKDMFLTYRVDVTKHLCGSNADAVLELHFTSGVTAGRRELARLGSNGSDDHINFGGPERLFLRKAQYHWGWDWGPALNTCGPFGNIYLQKYSRRVEDVLVKVHVARDLDHAQVSIDGTVCGGGAGDVTVELLSPDGALLEKQVAKGASFHQTFEVSEPQLWHPFMYGDQPLYKAVVSVDGHVEEREFGIRRLRLVQEPLKTDEGLTFTFEVNNRPVFCGGSNWIPGDNFLPRMTADRYEKWIRLAKSGNQSMIRVWGGGIFETEAFYNACDREGVLVWQDFLFACGNYPAHQEFQDLVKQEVTQMVKRARHHPSLVLLAGNNEDYLLANRYGWKWDVDDEDGPWDETNFPARLLYERTIPEVCEELCPDIPYWRSSPYGGKEANDPTIGDVHNWDVWHGAMSPYQDYIKYLGRFVSEFGFESPPSMRVIERAISDPRERQSQSRTFDAHDKGPGYERRYGMYLSENYRFRMDPLEDYVYCAQMLQAEAMYSAMSQYRRNFGGADGHNRCSGSLVWQLNDIWCGQSWALVDVDAQPKPAFYSVKRALAPIALGIERTVTKSPSYIIRSYSQEKGAASIWVASAETEDKELQVFVRAFDIESGRELQMPEKFAQGVRVVARAMCSTELFSGVEIPNPDQTVVLVSAGDRASLRDQSWAVSWPEPLKYVRFSRQPKLTIKVHNDEVELSTNVPLKGVVLQTRSGDDAEWDMNYVDLVPKVTTFVGVKGLNKNLVVARWQESWELELKMTVDSPVGSRPLTQVLENGTVLDNDAA